VSRRLDPCRGQGHSSTAPFIQPYEKSKPFNLDSNHLVVGRDSVGSETYSEAEGWKDALGNLFYFQCFNQGSKRGYEREVSAAQKVEVFRGENGAFVGLVSRRSS